MRILIAVDAITGGAGNVAQILATYYAKRGEDVYLMFSKKKTFDSKYDLNKISEISEVTINKCYKKLDKMKEDLIPRVILKKYAE